MEDFFSHNHDVPTFSFNSSYLQDISPHDETSSFGSLMNSDFVNFDASSHSFNQEIAPGNISLMESQHELAAVIRNAGTGYEDSTSQSKIAIDGKDVNDDKKWGQQNTEGFMWNEDEERSTRQATSSGSKQKKVIHQELQPRTRTRVKRGHATDSHSIAERERRLKIKSRMKLLQSMIPGCDQIRGKIQILDEIIGYIQTLQNQVEMQAGALASLNPMLSDFEEINLGTSALSAEMLCRRPIHMGPSSDVAAPNFANPLLQANSVYIPHTMSQDSTDNHFANNR